MDNRIDVYYSFFFLGLPLFLGAGFSGFSFSSVKTLVDVLLIFGGANMASESQPSVPILNIAWTRYAQLDALSEKRDKPFYRWRRWIAILGVLAALFAVITQAYSKYIPYQTILLFLKILLIATPISAG